MGSICECPAGKRVEQETCEMKAETYMLDKTEKIKRKQQKKKL